MEKRNEDNLNSKSKVVVTTRWQVGSFSFWIETSSSSTQLMIMLIRTLITYC
jgi:hypothetical protein